MQFLLDLQTILKIYKNIFIQKIGSKNDNSSKVSLSLGAASWDVKKAASVAWLAAALGNQVVSCKLKRCALQRRHRQGEAKHVRAALTAGAGEDGGGGAEGVVSIGNKGT